VLKAQVAAQLAGTGSGSIVSKPQTLGGGREGLLEFAV